MDKWAEIGGNSAKQLERNIGEGTLLHSTAEHFQRGKSQSMNTGDYVNTRSFKFRCLKSGANVMLSCNSSPFIDIKTCPWVSLMASAC